MPLSWPAYKSSSPGSSPSRASIATWRTSSFESGTGLSLGSGALAAGDQPDQSDDARPRAHDGEHHQHRGEPRRRCRPARITPQTDGGHQADDGRADRPAPDQHECDPYTPYGGRFRLEAENEDTPHQEDRRAGHKRGPYPARTPHLGSSALNCSSSRTVSFNFCAFSSLDPAPGPATTSSVF